MEGISKGKLNTPLKGLFYGIPGVGKSTLAASFPKPLVLDIEGSTGRLDVDRVELRNQTFDDGPGSIMDWTRKLGRESHEYQTLVIDTIDWLEPKIWEQTSKRLQVASIEVPGFHKGYRESSLIEWPAFLGNCTYLVEIKNMNVVLLAHCEQKRVIDPMVAEYDRYDINLHKWAGPKCVEWAEVVGFLITEKMVQRLGQREKVDTNNERILLINEGGHYVAKNRFGFKKSAIRGEDGNEINYELLAKELKL